MHANQNTASWIVIHIAHSEESAQEIMDLLTREGFWIQIRPAAGSSGEALFEVCALSSEAKEARSLILERGF